MHEKDWQAEIALLQQRERKARAILGVSASAGPEEIRRAYRRASLANHPDANRRNAGCAGRFHMIRCAYKFLTEGQAHGALDDLPCPTAPRVDGKYRLDNAWGYWCWWREKYFGQ